MEHDIVAAYLRRIGMTEPPGPPSVDLLTELHMRHLGTVPFENLSIHLDEPIVLDEDALVDKIVRRRRGGFCYELNGLFAVLLGALGFRVTRHAARVFDPEGSLGPPFDHLVLVVQLGDRWLVDVGFGRLTTYPLRLDSTEVQDDPEGKFLVTPAPYGDIDLVRDGKPQYRMETRPRSLDDFTMGAWWNSTSPASHFTRSLTCSLRTEDGRVTLSADRLIRTVGDERTETVLPDDEAVLEAYQTIFGVVLERVPKLRTQGGT
ncbi:MAG TPA: arylamine N-acetyltransferase [Actinophytocola sp.]|uniref:arylamine N-acetyltransferase family protein n=1 Tax=Actinophytocola sp. TaxID=1872138 RepID=UPI002DDD0CD1|nr:arylamine N-acetyltransferase [Actinophytocola sp.]HEV2781816.1 arylamine N-acetyltransferase [Actinophytocola sp.]